MLKGFGSHVRHNVVAYLALFFALGGTAIAAKPLITGDQIEDDSVTGVDVLEPSLAKVPNADELDGIDSPAFIVEGDSATGDLAGTYPNPTIRPPEGWHEIGAANQPPFHIPPDVVASNCPDTQWENFGAGFNTAAFYRDREGRVFLKGLVANGSLDPTSGNGLCAIFVLPPGYRPAAHEVHSVISNDALGRVDIFTNNLAGFPAGRVVVMTGDPAYVSLDGISFRCAPSGQDGCP